ncbi:hypothetical protein AALP_AA3G344600 [Arabis alpina]|uniref:non-specific serine/threonine protein kinase n=1 Tax=Arabis alpina TaxID=50452 RepID=A0A087HDK7_ARAAL|nr:hypothetical protein AALP_AA3G344600 [Arabis alpina]
MMDNRQLPPIDFGAIRKATNNFSTEIGHGGCGDVFRGRLLSGQEIAVKKLKNMSSKKNTEQFYTELRVIASMQHVNVVRLLGWCVHREEKLLVYEYMESGSLEHHLFDGAKSCELKWQKRFDIIIGVSRGLDHLQNDSRIKIIHRDLKPANVLLDMDMIPKISDFGFARASEHNIHVLWLQYQFSQLCLAKVERRKLERDCRSGDDTRFIITF